MSKTNRSPMMRIFATLLCATLFLSCIGVTGALAKYTSATTGSDKVQVAKWEFTVDGVDIANATEQVITFDLFNTIQDDNAPVIGGADDANVDNAADTDADTIQLIAPGTGGAFDLVVKNLSQVDAEYDMDLNITKSDSTIPVEFMAKVGDTTLVDWTYDLDDLDFTNRQLAYLGQGTDVDNETITIYWRWAFEQPVGAGETYADLAAADEADTLLGIAAQAAAPTILVDVAILATQVD